MENQLYYAHIDKAEPSDEKLYMELHCLRPAAVDDLLLQQPGEFRNTVLKEQDIVITIDQPPNLINRAFGEENLPETESLWTRIYTTQDRHAVPALLFTGAEAPIEIFIDKIERQSEYDRLKQGLDAEISMKGLPEADDSSIRGWLQNRDTFGEHVAVFNVGQGGCSAICNSFGQPLLYFDLGGGCYANKHSYARCLQFCFTAEPAILLSHWDTDHYQSAKLNAVYCAERWVVPRQPIGPVHYRFLSSLRQVLVWPDYLQHLEICYGTVLKCNGAAHKKNHSGLAFSTDLQGFRNSIRQVLLPADAAYTYIPNTLARYDGLVATHHGANFDFRNSPVPMSKGKSVIVYSYGSGNSYRHPRTTAVNAHSVHWPGLTMHTINGHIALTDNRHVPGTGCGGFNCDLMPVQFC